MMKYKLVPIEPTEEMVMAAVGVDNPFDVHGLISLECKRIYCAMIAAAPQPQPIDVEKLKREVCVELWTVYDDVPECGVTKDVIDHLAASGYLRAAPQLAQEAEELHEMLANERTENIKQFALIEQLRKERDDLERRLNGNSEWFFRWIARGKGGSVGMTMEQCVDMIWNHPDNPYAEYNPWDKTSQKSEE